VSTEFRSFLDRIDAEVPPGLAVHLIPDNYTTHKTQLIQRWLVRHPRFQLLVVDQLRPINCVCVHLVERWFAELTAKQIRRGSRRSTRALENAIRLYLTEHNTNPRRYSWVKSADDIIDSIALFARRTSAANDEARSVRPTSGTSADTTACPVV
jgi:hypothetical protein